MNPPFCPPIPQEYYKQALLCHKVFQSLKPSGDSVCLAQYLTTGKLPVTSDVFSFWKLISGVA